MFDDGSGLLGQHGERHLERILGIMRVGECPPADIQHHRPMTLHQRFERCLISLGCKMFQKLEIRGVHVSLSIYTRPTPIGTGKVNRCNPALQNRSAFCYASWCVTTGFQVLLQEIADRAGVSRTTVSRALRNDPRISTATRQRIQDLAVKLGYRANPYVSALMTQLRRTGKPAAGAVLGYLTSWGLDGAWQKREVYQIYLSASERAHQLGYRLDPFSTRDPRARGKRLTEILRARGIEGLVLEPVGVFRAWGHLSLDWSPFACVAIGFTIPRPGFHRVTTDYHANMLLALRTLRRMKYRRIGLALRTQFDRRTNGRPMAAYLRFQHDLDVRQQAPVFLNELLAPDELMKWYRRHRPDAIVTNEKKVLTWLRERKARVPEDVGVVQIKRDHGDSAIAGIDINTGAIGVTAIETLHSQLLQNERGLPSEPRLVLVEGRWCEGSTVQRQ